MHELRNEHAGARAASVLVQLPIRCLRGVWRSGHPQGGERGARHRGSDHLDSRGRDPALGRADRAPASFDHSRPGRVLQVRSQHAVGRAAAEGARRHSPRLRQPQAQVPLPCGRRIGHVQRAVGRRARERDASLRGDDVGRRARAARCVHDDAAVPRLWWCAAEAREPRRDGRWPLDRRDRGHERRSRALLLRDGRAEHVAAAGNRRTDPEGSHRATALSFS